MAPEPAPDLPLANPVSHGTRDDASAFHQNRRRALSIAAAPGAALLVVIAGAAAAAGDAVIGLVVGAAVALASWAAVWRGATGYVLRTLGARPGDDTELARADNLVDGLCASMGLEAPEILVIDDIARQAISLGRRSGSAVVVVTSGLLASMEPVPLEAVLAHELVHIKRGDVAPATVAAAVLLPVATVLPVSGLVHRMAGRGREMRTDTLAVSVTRYPPGLREALVLMAEGPVPRATSPLVRRAVARTTRWLWTVPLPDGDEGSDRSARLAQQVGELDAPAARVAALDEV